MNICTIRLYEKKVDLLANPVSALRLWVTLALASLNDFHAQRTARITALSACMDPSFFIYEGGAVAL